MNEDTGTSIQNQNLIGDDVADEINAAIKNEQMSGNVTPPTVVQPTHSSGALLDTSNTDDSSDNQSHPDNGNVATPDEPALEPAPTTEAAPAETPPAEPPADEHQTDDISTSPSLPPEDDTNDSLPADTSTAAAAVAGEGHGTGNFTELQAIKQDALTKLGPLVQHLDQNPEEHFNTLLMMIRASDDASLVQTAYEAAEAIADDKKKAQALLDVINEVNYLTRPQPEDNQS